MFCPTIAPSPTRFGMISDKRHIAVALAGAGAFLNLYAPQAVLPLLAREFNVGPADIS